MICSICKKEFGGNTGLQTHLRCSHKEISYKEYYDKYLRLDGEGLCKTCGKETPFININQGYKEHCNCYCSNNDPNAISKRSNSLKNKSKDEKLKISNKKKETCAKNHPDDPTCGMFGSKKHKESMINIYGNEHPSQILEIKEKIANTNLERGNNKCSLQRDDVKLKIKQNNMDKYNFQYYVQTEEFQEKRKSHFQTKYGEKITNNSQLLSNKIKVQETNLKNYGYKCNFQDPKTRTLISQKMMELYGVPWYCLSEKCRDKISYNKRSKPNVQFENILKDLNILYKSEFKVDNYFYDFYLPEHKLLIEINPTITHNVTWNPFGDHSGIDKNYHFNKTQVANKNGYECICIWDWNDKEKIAKSIKNKNYEIIKRNINNFIVNNKGEIQTDFSDKFSLEIYDDGQDVIYQEEIKYE